MSIRTFLNAALCAVACTAVPHLAEAASYPATGGGGAYAAFLNTQIAGVALRLGPVAPVGVCATGASGTQKNYVASLTPNPVIGGISALDTITTYRTSTSAAVQSTSTIQNVNILNGLIKATALEAVANSFGSSSGASSNASGTTFTNLVINGTAINASVAPNTKLTLPGLGYVILNQQLLSKPGGAFTVLNVNMITVHITNANSLGLPVGLSFIVGHASSTITPTVAPFNVSAGAYGLNADADVAGTEVKSGALAPVGICLPGSTTNYVATANTPLGTVGAMQDMAAGSLTSSLVSGAANVQVASVNLLGGLISGGALTSNAAVTFNGTALGATGSATFTNLVIAGIPIMATPPANTKITIPGLGYVVLNEQVNDFTKMSIAESVTAMHVVITTPNALGLATGAQASIGYAHAGILGY